MDNKTIAAQLKQLSKLMELHGENLFKARSYSTAAFNIEQLSLHLDEMNADDILRIKGVGDAIGKKILTLLETGTFPLLEKYIQETPPGILEMMGIKGLGIKKIITIWKELEIETLGELLYACNENRLLLYKGFGEKTQAGIQEAIEFYLSNQGFFLYAQIENFAKTLEATLQAQLPGFLIALTGDFRRQAEIVEMLELVSTADVERMREFLLPHFTILEEQAGMLLAEHENKLKLKLHCCDQQAFTVTLFTTTGTHAFTSAAPFDLADPKFSAIKEERALFETAGFPYIVPALRESGETWKDIQAHGIPVLIKPEDIKGVIHAHSNWSDGGEPLEKMARAARDQGYEYLVISDHSRSAFYAKGLSIERIQQQQEEIDQLNKELFPFRIFKSIESDILNDGNLDYPDEILKTFDLVIASVHSNLKMNGEKAMQRLLKAVENPFTTILGHPTGRLLLSRPGYPVDHKQLIDACATHKVVIEINAHPRRLDLDWSWIPYAVQKGVLLSIDPDAHSISGIGDIRYGVLAAQKGGLTAAQNLSSFSREALETYVQNRR